MGQVIRDEKGNVLGYFISATEYKSLQYELARQEFDKQEALDTAAGVTRKYDGTNGMTTAEAIAHLERLGREAREGR